MDSFVTAGQGTPSNSRDLLVILNKRNRSSTSIANQNKFEQHIMKFIRWLSKLSVFMYLSFAKSTKALIKAFENFVSGPAKMLVHPSMFHCISMSSP